MAKGATAIARRLFDAGRLQGLIGLGGTGNSALATEAMRAVPIGVPKLMVSTVVSGDTRSYVGAVDVTMMSSVVDMAGINQISKHILTNAASATVGMARAYEAFQPAQNTKPPITASMFGVTTPCVTAAHEWLERHAYEVLVFHATGAGGRSLEDLIKAGFIAESLDVTTTEWADELVGGVLSAGPHRLEAAGAKLIPQVVSLGAGYGQFAGLPSA